ncbi:uncharacterized oxidoreductase YoxD-like [Uranotaenia lowii]|uniref:uncharacterized oxidoreductase YoxD-like n=1 Tax=Uranotaenia lowii TaxID=190385 RepID=UPI00247B16E5|nr:uncharacterized oxidoreductase YoxD-like [Uranotaenia lowii]
MGSYLKCNEGAYQAAELNGRKHDRVKFVLEVSLEILMLIPALVVDFFKAYVWRRKKSVSNQVALVTGGGNGLGRAICFRLAREGCRLAVVDIDLVAANQTVHRLRSMGAEAEAFRTDVSDFRAVRELRKGIEKKLGPVDILINNAALLAFGNSTDGSEEDAQRVIDVNLMAHCWTIREFKPGMIERKRGHIVGISSILGFAAIFRATIYAASKFGVRGLMLSVAEELAFLGLDKQINTSCVYPSFMATRKELVDIISGSYGACIDPLAPEQAANEIVDGVLLNKSEFIVGHFLDKLAFSASGLLPKRIYRTILRSSLKGNDVH